VEHLSARKLDQQIDQTCQTILFFVGDTAAQQIGVQWCSFLMNLSLKILSG